ncbi:Latrophilin-like protein LAT-2 [Aphelenchoides fujianensis]|nr:Latrophilin-like protein LAT-2 [Aphelenchoides fujianensis]
MVACRSLHPNIRVVIHRNLCLCLLCGELLFLCVGIDRVESPAVCRFVAIGLPLFLHSGLLLDYLMLIRVFEASRSRTAYFYTFGFVLPAVIVCLSVLFAAEDYGTEDYCWIDVQSTTIWNRDRSLAVRVAGWLKGSFMLLCLLGTTWVLGFLTAVQVLQPFAAFLFTIFNSLQGLFILLLHVCCNEKARQAIRRCLRNGVCCTPPLSDSSHQSSSYGHSNFFALNKVLHWLPLRSRSSGSSGGSQKNSREHEVRFKPVAVVQVASADEDDPSRSQEEKQEDEQVIRNRLLAASPQPGVTIERF